jgi:hypothetical protein
MRVPNLKFWSPRQRGGWKLVVHITVCISSSAQHSVDTLSLSDNSFYYNFGSAQRSVDSHSLPDNSFNRIFGSTQHPADNLPLTPLTGTLEVNGTKYESHFTPPTDSSLGTMMSLNLDMSEVSPRRRKCRNKEETNKIRLRGACVECRRKKKRVCHVHTKIYSSLDA